ncbi:hypothetical protein MHBO_001452 [Bonamia ostreae]|uniref:Bromo domain-containing protein n=1 Tax=Bonamia ostreae TaxID=126728 RepID=A0ABV2AJI7_9EUKA
MYKQSREWFSVKNVPEEEHNFYLNESIKQDCILILDRISKEDANNLFLNPVDLKLFPLYTRFIEKPIDLTTVKKKLNNGVYRETTDFSDDVRQIWLNCELFNNPGDVFSKSAKICSKLFEDLWARLLKKLDNFVRLEEENTYGFDRIMNKSSNSQLNKEISQNESKNVDKISDKEKMEIEQKAKAERLKLKNELIKMSQNNVDSISSATESE